MRRVDALGPEFKKAVGLPEKGFADYLEEKFDKDTAREVLKVFEQMGLPAPRNASEFMDGEEGAVVFLNRYGVSIRIEHSASMHQSDRINETPFILQPLATIPMGRATIEICPGATIDQANAADRNFLIATLNKQKIKFWDDGLTNIGRLPYKTESFPDGIPVVIDRLSVFKKADEIKPVQELSSSHRKDKTSEVVDIDVGGELMDVQEILYGGLRRCFEASWPDAQKMTDFWKMCRHALQEGILIDGWNAEARESLGPRKNVAATSAASYESRLQSSGAAVVAVSQLARPAPR